MPKMNDDQSEGASATASRPQLNDAPAVAFPIILMVALSLLLVGGLIFRDFLFGEKLLLYKDIGKDSITDTYPTFVHLSDYIRRQGFPSWSFYVGMGQSLFYLTGSLIWEPIVWLPRQLIPFALVFQHLLKVLIAGLLFFRFLRLRGLNLCGSLGGALFLAFSAHMCMGSCWIISADDTVCFTALLFAVEEAIVCGRWLYLPIAVALSGLVTVFHLYLSAVVLCLYVPARLVEIYGWRPMILFRVSTRLAMFALLGVGLGAIVFLGSSYLVLNSPRASGTIGNFAFGPAPAPFQLGSPLYYITAALRPFSGDMIGTGDDYRGWENYYEGPLSYCGLLSLLIFPQAFAGATRPQRVLYAGFLALIAIPMLFPWFRHLFWLFQGGYFRTFSLFSIFVVLVLSMTALSRYTERGTINLWTLGATLAALLSILHCPIYGMQGLINHELMWKATVFLIVYAVLLIIGRLMKRQSLAGWLILGVSAVELIHFDRIIVERPTITKQELNERFGHNDTVDAVRDIKANDNGFFRITKSWGPAMRSGFNDAMVFGYYGTSSYSSFNNLNYIKFLMAMEVISGDDVATDVQWSPGLIGHPLLSTFVCEKYVLAKNPVTFQTADHYEFIRRYGSLYLFRNKAFLPLGLTFNRYLPEDIFLQLPSWAKPQALLHAVVLSDRNGANETKLPQISLNELKERMRETSVPDALAERRATAFSIRSFRQTRIDGAVRLNQRGMMVCQMPFDAGWHAIVDGHNAPVLKVDSGLLGVVLEGGEHSLELNYRPPFLYTGAAVSFVSCLVLLLSIWRWPRLRQPH
jgi:hypothetical protein